MDLDRAEPGPDADVPPETPEAAKLEEDVCLKCVGSGSIDGRRCDFCGGSGRVLVPVGEE